MKGAALVVKRLRELLIAVIKCLLKPITVFIVNPKQTNLESKWKVHGK